MMELFIDTVIKSSIVLLLTMGTTWQLRRQSAALRHLVWTVGLVSALALPLLGPVLPAWQPQFAGIAVSSLERIREVQHPRHAADFVATAIQSAAAPIPISAAAQPPAPPSWITPARLLLATWILGMLTVASLLLMEVIKLARVAIRSDAVREQSWRDLASEVSRALRLTRSVRLMRNPNASVLGTWGTFRPRVLLPRESSDWSSERMRVVLGHELAHVKRNDWLVQIVAESARAIYWFNPLFWIACAQLRGESEHACDDSAMRLGVDGPTYAGHVLDLARTLKHSNGPGSAALAMANTSNLERRLIAMLNPTLNRTVTTKSAVAIVILIALALTLPLAAMQSPAARSIDPDIHIATAARSRVPAVIEHVQTVTEQASQNVEPSVTPIRVSRFGGSFEGQNSINNNFTLTAALVAGEPAQPAAAQNLGGTITGGVLDMTGALIPGVKVNLTNSVTGEIRNTLTNDSGKFTVTDLAAGVYSMTTALSGFQPSVITAIPVSPGQTTAMNVTLKIITTFTGIDVVAARPSTGLTCFSVFGNVKADGTPFTQADCPNGTPAYPSANSAAIADLNQKLAAIPKPEISTPYVAPTTNANAPVQLQANGRPYPIRVGGDVQAGNLIYKPNPAYPETARARGIEGNVVLAATIGPDGTMRAVKIIKSSDPAFETPTLDSILQWRYKPTLLNGQPIEVTTTISVNYTLGR